MSGPPPFPHDAALMPPRGSRHSIPGLRRRHRAAPERERPPDREVADQGVRPAPEPPGAGGPVAVPQRRNFILFSPRGWRPVSCCRSGGRRTSGRPGGRGPVRQWVFPHHRTSAQLVRACRRLDDAGWHLHVGRKRPRTARTAQKWCTPNSGCANPSICQSFHAVIFNVASSCRHGTVRGGREKFRDLQTSP